MRQFIKRLFIFIIPLLAIFLIAEVLYRRIPNDYVKTQGREIDILILGSSHSYRGVNPALFTDHCFNFAMVSQSLDYDKKLLEAYIQYMPELNYIIIPVSYFTFRQSLKNGKENWRMYNYQLYTDINELTKKERRSIKANISIANNNGKYVTNRLFNYYLKKKNNTVCDENGWGKWPKDLQKDLKASAQIAAERHEDNSYDFKEKLKELEEIIDICEKHNCKILLYTPPVTSYYFNELDPVKWDLINEKCDSVDQKNKNVMYVNFIHDKSFDNSLFGDGDHLNLEGSNILSIKLDKIIMNSDK